MNYVGFVRASGCAAYGPARRLAPTPCDNLKPMLGQAANPVTVVPAARAGANYGCRRNPGASDPRCPPGQRRHHGVDIPAPEGSPVFAPLPGVVQQVWRNGDLSRYGNLFLLYVPGLNRTLVFAHLMEPSRKADGTLWRRGDAVAAGDLVGRVGYTGACGRGRRVSAHGVACTPCGQGGQFLCSGPSGAHLHLEVRPGRVNRPNPVGDSLHPVEFARAQGFALHSGGAGLGTLPRTSDPYAYTPDKYYWDPTGFEPGDDEPASAPSTIPWGAVGIGLGVAVCTYLLVKVL